MNSACSGNDVASLPKREGPYGDVCLRVDLTALKTQNDRIPSHGASQMLSIYAFGREFNFTEFTFV